MTFLDLLTDFPSLRPTLEEILDKLPPQQPRYYSHVTSPLASPTVLRFAFTLIRWQSPLASREKCGLCTDWIYRMSVRRGFIDPLSDGDATAIGEEEKAERRAKEHDGYYADLDHMHIFARPTRVRLHTSLRSSRVRA